MSANLRKELTSSLDNDYITDNLFDIFEVMIRKEAKNIQAALGQDDTRNEAMVEFVIKAFEEGLAELMVREFAKKRMSKTLTNDIRQRIRCSCGQFNRR